MNDLTGMPQDLLNPWRVWMAL